MIGWAALILAVVALVRSTRWHRDYLAARKLHRMANRLEPIDLATPEQFGVVTHGGPPGGYVVVQRNGALMSETFTTATGLGVGQRVRIDSGGTAHPLLPEE